METLTFSGIISLRRSFDIKFRHYFPFEFGGIVFIVDIDTGGNVMDSETLIIHKEMYGTSSTISSIRLRDKLAEETCITDTIIHAFAPYGVIP